MSLPTTRKPRLAAPYLEAVNQLFAKVQAWVATLSGNYANHTSKKNSSIVSSRFKMSEAEAMAVKLTLGAKR